MNAPTFALAFVAILGWVVILVAIAEAYDWPAPKRPTRRSQDQAG